MLFLLPVFALYITGIISLLANAPKPRSTGERVGCFKKFCRESINYTHSTQNCEVMIVYPFTHTSNDNRTTPRNSLSEISNEREH